MRLEEIRRNQVRHLKKIHRQAQLEENHKNQVQNLIQQVQPEVTRKSLDFDPQAQPEVTHMSLDFDRRRQVRLEVIHKSLD